MSDTKSFYESFRERTIENAKKLPAVPKEIPQHILWLKSAAIERIENIDKALDDNVRTFRLAEGKEISLTKYMELERTTPVLFGFSEHYLNLLMHYAYEAGKNNVTENLTRNFEESTRDMKMTLDKIINALDDGGFLPESNSNW